MNGKLQKTIYWTKSSFNDWNLILAATEEALCHVGNFHEESLANLEKWGKKHFKSIKLVENEQKLVKYIAELKEYCSGERTNFTIPIKYYGTDFQKSVWDTLVTIPYGETWTYSDIAQAINRPKAVRAVGGAIGANQLLIIVPCHRVIGKDGSLTGFSSGLDIKKRLLKLEKSM